MAHSQVTYDLMELYLGADAAVEWKKDHPGATALRSTFWITVKGGVITLFEEQFIP